MKKNENECVCVLNLYYDGQKSVTCISSFVGRIAIMYLIAPFLRRGDECKSMLILIKRWSTSPIMQLTKN